MTELTQEQCKEMDQDIKEKRMQEEIAESREEEFYQWKLDNEIDMAKDFINNEIKGGHFNYLEVASTIYEDDFNSYCKEEFMRCE